VKTPTVIKEASPCQVFARFNNHVMGNVTAPLIERNFELSRRCYDLRLDELQTLAAALAGFLPCSPGIAAQEECLGRRCFCRAEQGRSKSPLARSSPAERVSVDFVVQPLEAAWPRGTRDSQRRFWAHLVARKAS
jgi:hypothetical protein